ncbi:MAG: tetratricopeptide repeat protein [bacterium]
MSEVAANLVRQALRDRGGTFARQENELRQLYARLHKDLVEAVRLARASTDKPVLVKALKALGQIERDAGHAQESLALYEEAVAVCRIIGDPLALAHTVRHVGDLYLSAGRPALAGPCFDEALALYRTDVATAPLDLANAIRPYALLKEELGLAAEASALWQETRSLYAQVGIDVGVEECDARLAALVAQPDDA